MASEVTGEAIAVNYEFGINTIEQLKSSISRRLIGAKSGQVYGKVVHEYNFTSEEFRGIKKPQLCIRYLNIFRSGTSTDCLFLSMVTSRITG